MKLLLNSFEIDFLMKLLTLIIILVALFSSFNSNAQIGPGGSGNTSDNRFWYFPDYDLLSNGDPISNIVNKGGNTLPSSQTAASRQPNYQDGASALNGYGVISYDGTNDFLTITSNTDLNTSTTAQANRHLTVVLNSGSDITTRQVVYEEGGAARGLSVYIFNGQLYVGAHNNASDGVGSPWSFKSVSTPISINTNYILTYRFIGNNSTTGTIEAYINGGIVGTANNVGLLYSHGADIGIGAKNNATEFESGGSNGTGNYFGGSIAEFIHYNRNLNNAELDLLWNYLSSKFNISIVFSDLYDMDTTPNLDYDHEVAGIGQNTDGSSSSDGQGCSVVRINNPTSLDNNDYLLVGHNNLPLTTTNAAAPSGVESILNRSWRSCRTNDVGATDILLDLSASGLTGTSASEIFLIVDNIDANFSDGLVIIASSISSGYATFTGVTLQDGDFFTFGSDIKSGYGFSGPGGIGSESQYRFWFDASDLESSIANNSSVTNFPNKGGNTNNAVQGSSGNAPTFKNSGSERMNQMPAIAFDGNDFLEIVNNTDVNLGEHAEYSFYVALQTDSDVGTRQVIYEQGGTIRGLNIYIFNGNVYVGAWNIDNDGDGSPWGFSSVNTAIAGSTDNILSFRMKGDATSTGEIICSLNGSDFGTIPGVGYLYQHIGGIGIGGKNNDTYFENGTSSGDGNYFLGSISEFIIYNSFLPNVQHRILNNYLSSKYDIGIVNDEYNQDLSINGDYDHEVAGIGRLVSNVIHEKAKGDGFPIVENASDLDANEYLLWGHNNDPICNSSNVPAALNNRLTRVWKASENGEVGAVTISFYLGDLTYGTLSNSSLLIDSDGDFSDATIVPSSGTSGDTVTFNISNLNDGDFFTVGTTDSYVDNNLSSTTWNGSSSSDWNTSANWSAGIPSKDLEAIISIAGTAPILSGNADVFSLDIQAGASLEINATDTLRVLANVTLNGTLTPNNSTLVLENGCSSRIFTVNTSSDIYNLVSNVTEQTSIAGTGELSLRGMLEIVDGDFATNGQLTLISDATETARIFEIPAGDSITGTIQMQRFIDAGETNWRFLASAVNSIDLEQYDDDFITSGISGSDYPTWPSATNPWASIYTYNESTPGVRDNGFFAVPSMSYVPSTGEGLWIWCGDTITGTTPFTIDHIGVVNQGTIPLPVTFTNSSNQGDGWNMVGNPYPCTIDWDAVDWTKININTAIYIWNPDLANYSSYVPGMTPGSGAGTNGGSNNIASSQAFWIQANAIGPSLQVTEKCKLKDDQFFIKVATLDENIRFKLSNGALSDEMVIRRLDSATALFDGNYDAWKFYNVNSLNNPQMALNSEGNDLSISSYSKFDKINDTIKLQGTVGDTMILAITEKNGFQGCLNIVDILSNQVYDLNQTSSIAFVLQQTGIHDRFIISHVPIPEIETSNVSCYDNNDGTLQIQNLDTASTYSIMYNGSIFWNGNNTILLENLEPGAYEVISTFSGCGTFSEVIQIEELPKLTLDIQSFDATCATCCDGQIYIQPTNQSGAVNYWIDSVQVGSYESNLCQGNHIVQVIDENLCEASYIFEIGNVLTTEELSFNFKVFPNPANETINILFSESNDIYWELIDINGRIVKNSMNSLNNEINLKDLKSGFYIFKIKNRGQFYFEKVEIIK
ncbi:MAG: hypothetical protein ACI8Q1_000622 [Parvicella sp.]